ncbi:MAG: hypothetical protein ABIP75_16935 [Pyrinomonadaceae bacterium]
MRNKVLLVACLITAAVLSAACSKANSNSANANQAGPNGGNVNSQMPVVPPGENPTTVPGSAPTGPDPTQGVTPGPATHPGPDNSETSTVMDKNGDVVETRVFKNNPNVSKVEVLTKIKDGKIVKTITVYDKNGKAHSVPESRSESIMQETGDDIARVAGIIAGGSKDAANDAKEKAEKVANKTVDASQTAADKAKEEANKIKRKLP